MTHHQKRPLFLSITDPNSGKIYDTVMPVDLPTLKAMLEAFSDAGFELSATTFFKTFGGLNLVTAFWRELKTQKRDNN